MRLRVGADDALNKDARLDTRGIRSAPACPVRPVIVVLGKRFFNLFGVAQVDHGPKAADIVAPISRAVVAKGRPTFAALELKKPPRFTRARLPVKCGTLPFRGLALR